MIDSVLAAFNLDQTIRTNVVPAANGVYDLGAPTHKFKDLYLNGTITFPDASVQTTAALISETITLATLKTEVAASTNFTDFQSRIAAL